MDGGVDALLDAGSDAGADTGPGPTATLDAGMSVDAAVGSGIVLSQSCTAGTQCMAGTTAVSCCETTKLSAGSYVEGPDALQGGKSRTATVGAFWMDRFEVSVSRFRAFVAAYDDGFRPSVDQGAHAGIPGSGWQNEWSGLLPLDALALRTQLVCDARFATWRDTAGPDDNHPINCVGHSMAFAFCIWDGGRLPTEAEWEYAAVGGSNGQRLYPWGQAALDTQRAVYNCLAENDPTCTLSRIVGVPLGDRPMGAGRFGQLDLAGGMSEWVLDGVTPYSAAACNDCAQLGSNGSFVLRGGSWLDSDPLALAAKARSSESGTDRRTFIGWRCAYDVDRATQF